MSLPVLPLETIVAEYLEKEGCLGPPSQLQAACPEPAFTGGHSEPNRPISAYNLGGQPVLQHQQARTPEIRSAIHSRPSLEKAKGQGPTRDRNRPSYEMRALQDQVTAWLREADSLQEKNDQLRLKTVVLKELAELREHELQLCSDSPQSSSLLELPEVEDWDLESFRTFWKTRLDGLCRKLSDVNYNRLGPVPSEVNSTVPDLIRLRTQLWLKNPRLACQVHDMNLETLVPEKPGEEHWKKFWGAVLPSTEQREKIRQCLEIYEEKEEKLAGVRSQLMKHLEELVQGSSPARVGQLEDLLGSGPALEVLQKLERNISKARNLRQLLGGYIVVKVLAPLQIAHGMIASYPYLPDPWAAAAALK